MEKIILLQWILIVAHFFIYKEELLKKILAKALRNTNIEIKHKHFLNDFLHQSVSV